jgi:hypothetical protein
MGMGVVTGAFLSRGSGVEPEMSGQIRAIPSRTHSRAARIARAIQRAVIRQQLTTPEGRKQLYAIASELDIDGALALLEESHAAPHEERHVILRELSRRPEEELRLAALRELAA